MKNFNLLFLIAFLCLNVSYSQKEIAPLLQEDFRNANAVIRSYTTQVDISHTRSMNVQMFKLITVLNPKGDKTAFSYANYDKDWELKSIEALIYNSAGKLIDKVKEKDFIDESAVNGSTLYSDSRIKYYDYKPHSYPYSIAFSVEYKTNNTAFIPSHSFISHYNTYLQESEYILKYDKLKTNLNIKEKNFDDYNIKRITFENGVKYKAENLSPIPNEDLHVPSDNFMPRVMAVPLNFSLSGYDAKEIKDWTNLGEWFQNQILSGRTSLSQSTIAKVNELTSGVTDKLEKAKIIYQHVQDNTRYISVQVGIGGYQPIEAQEVDELKYGDCKGLSNYTKALLEVAGVESYYTHVEAGDAKINFEEDFASLAQGNHAILSIPYDDKLYWIDCTSQTSPFGFLGSFTDDRKVFVMTPDGGKIVKTPKYINQDNSQSTVANITFSPEGNVDIVGSINSKGIQYDRRQYIEKLSLEELQKRDYQYWSKIDNIKVIKHELENDKDEINFKEDFHLTGENYTTVIGNRLFIPVNPIHANSYIPERYRDRKTPFHISRGYYDEDKIVINLPENYIVESLLEKFNLESEFGNYSMSIEVDEQSLIYQKKLLIKEGRYSKEKYSDYREFRKKIAEIETKKISLIKN